MVICPLHVSPMMLMFDRLLPQLNFVKKNAEIMKDVDEKLCCGGLTVYQFR